MTKTYSAKPSEVKSDWYVVDADGLVLGRLAAEVAKILRGKHKPYYTAHIDCGDHVVVINADKLCLTGNKLAQKTYYRHTGYPGGIKSRTAGETLAGAHPERLLQDAVRRMLPRGPLARSQYSKLRVYASADHPHEAQKPKLLDIAARNAKNKRSVAI